MRRTAGPLRRDLRADLLTLIGGGEKIGERRCVIRLNADLSAGGE
jgi:hypothetical protein